MKEKIIQNLFNTKQPLFVLSSSRSKREFYINFIKKDNLDFNLHKYIDSGKNEDILKNCFNLFDFINHNDNKALDILPDALSISEFFTKIIYSKNAMIPRNVRDFFIFQALKNVKNSKKIKPNIGFLNFDESFMLFLQTSSVLLDFYDELKEYKIPITKESLLKFDSIDSYEEYSSQLMLLSEIYDEYKLLLELNSLSDSIYSNEIQYNYDIFKEYVESFSSIHIELEGFISPLQYEILQNASQITPIFLHFKTDFYNISHFKFIDKKLQTNKKYIYSISNKKLFSIEMKKLNKDSIKLYKTTKVSNQINLALYLASKWEKEILNGRAFENDFAIILPNESFCNYLITFDSFNLLNFAMGINISHTKEYNILENIYNNFLKNKTINLKEFFEFAMNNDDENIKSQLNKLKEQYKQNSMTIDNPNINHIETIITILFYKDETILASAMSILSELNLLSNKIYFNAQKIDFEKIFIFFMLDIAKLKKNDVGGGKIRVIGALEARSLIFKEVLILDFTDDYIPNVTHDDMFLNSKIRSYYNMPTRLDKENLYKHHYYNIMQNTQTTHISFVANNEKIPSNMLFELQCNIEMAQSIDKIYSYYDNTKQRNTIFYDEKYPTFNEHIYFNATSINTYKDCKRKFYFRYIEKLIEAENTQQQNIGIILHEWLYDVYKDYKGKILTTKDIDNIESNFFSKLQNLRNDIAKNNKLQIDMITFIMLDNFTPKMKAFFQIERERAKKHEIQIVGLEYDFKVNYDKYIFNGKIDRIDIVDSNIIIYDYKTGANPPSKDSLQMPFYAICIDLFQEFKYKDKYFAYYLLSSKQNEKILSMCNEEYIIEGENTIKEILNNFGENNEMTDKLSVCNNCSYKILCNRDY